ncbi:TPA: hypothetical protein ACH3X1_012239 [Trebouxia sp. C0004]
MTPPQKPRTSRGSASPVGSEAGSSAAAKVRRPSSTASMSRVLSLPRPPSAGALSARGRSGEMPEGHSARSTEKDHISVAVRVRPINERELERGDREVWGSVGDNQIGIIHSAAMPVKYGYDTVLDNDADNEQVYESTSERVVQSSMDGINGTIFAYGVTSSGKTHTMMGEVTNPGVVPRAIQDVFDIIEKTPDRDFLLRMSMMEIYNEVLNDLLDPLRANLKLREDPKRGFYVEGIKEETLVSAEHALSVIATGVAHRKVSATSFNEGSSRSHTLLRLSIESSERLDMDADPNSSVARTLSFLNLIDLAGSESAKAAVNKGHRTEGSYINKSLLTLGTVIAKLSDGNAAHIPFRDSKLTRLLQSSLTGNGARISVICTVTPASSQAEETHNTLKFATRAKKIEITAQRNEIVDQASLIRRYQEEIQTLRSQLEAVARERGDHIPIPAQIHDPLHPEVRNLRERLEEEHQALLTREQDKAALELRIARLTKLILHSTRIGTSTAAARKQRLNLLRSYSEHLSPTPESLRSLRKASDDGRGSGTDSPHAHGATDRELHHASLKVASWSSQNERVQSDIDLPGTPPGLDVSTRPSPQQLEEALAGIKSAGALFPGNALVYQVGAKQDAMYAPYDAEIDFLQDQISVLSDEIAERDKHIETLKSERASVGYEAGGFTGRGSRASSTAASDDGDRGVELQILYAEREFMAAQIKSANANTASLNKEVTGLKRQLSALQEAATGGHVQEASEGQLQEALLSSSSGSISNDIFADANRLAAELESEVPAEGPSEGPSTEGMQETVPLDGEVRERLRGMEQQVQMVLLELKKKEQQLAREKSSIGRFKELEANASAQLREISAENQSLKKELTRIEERNNELQGYGLDGMSADDLSDLIHGLTQAVERVRITVQLRRLANSSKQESASSPFPAPPSQGKPTPDKFDGPKKPGRASSSMSLESMRSVMSNLRSKTKSHASSASDLGNAR